MKNIIKFTLLFWVTTSFAKDNTPVVNALQFFNNACWEGEFIGSDDTDVHCYRDMVNGQFVRDNHIVDSKRGKYGGETVFWWVEDAQHVKYTYWDTHGAISNGIMLPTDNGFESPDEKYEMQNGKTMTIRTRWVIQSDDKYVMESVRVEGDAITRMFAIEYKKVPLRECPGPMCDK